MANIAVWRRLNGWVKASLIIGPLMLISALSESNWSSGLFGLALLAGGGWAAYSKSRSMATEHEPWPWPPELRAQAEALARPIDPTPKRILPPDDKTAMIAQVATTKDALARLIAEKPPAWPWTVFTSVCLQRRGDVKTRLRNVASGYQPRPGNPLSGQEYCRIAGHAFQNMTDSIVQLEQFMLSPAFHGAFGTEGDEKSADADAIVGIANRLMDYHERFLAEAETCVQTPVEHEALVFVQDTAAFTLLPLMSYDQFISTFCVRIGEAQDLLPYTHGGTVWFDDVTLTMQIPDGLSERVTAHIKRFNP